VEHLGNSDYKNRTITTVTSDRHGQKLTTAGASNGRYQAETTRILNEKYKHHSKIFPQNSNYSAEQSAKMNANYFTKKYNQKRAIISDSLSTMMAVSNSKRSKNPKTQLIRKLIDHESTKVPLLQN
jgi:hypothetical protein